MNYELFICSRYLRAKRKQKFISIIAVISIIGVMVGVSVMILVLAGMSGFEDDLKSKILGSYAHIVLLKHEEAFSEYRSIIEKVKKIKGVIGATPFTYDEVMLAVGSRVSGVIIRGIDLETVKGVLTLETEITVGKLEYLNEPPSEEEEILKLLDKENEEEVLPKKNLPGIIIGRELARSLAAFMMDEITVISPLGTITPTGTAPSFRKFKLVGIFESGMYEFDSKFAFIKLEEAQKFFGMGDTVSGIEIKIKDAMESDKIAQEIQDTLGFPYWTKDWKDMNKNLFSAIKLEKFFMRILLILIITVAAINIISTLVMMVLEKGKEIAILKSMGATDFSIMKIFMYQGLIIGIIGTLLGAIIGYGICFLNIYYKIIPLDPKIYYIDRLPMKVQFGDSILVIFTAIGISFLATLYPSWKASQVSPVEGIRYE